MRCHRPPCVRHLVIALAGGVLITACGGTGNEPAKAATAATAATPPSLVLEAYSAQILAVTLALHLSSVPEVGGYTARLEHRGGPALAGVSVRLTGDDGSSERYPQGDLPAQARLDLAIDDWLIEPGETVQVTWQGDTTGVKYRIP